MSAINGVISEWSLEMACLHRITVRNEPGDYGPCPCGHILRVEGTRAEWTVTHVPATDLE